MHDREKVINELTELYDEAYDRWVHRPYIEDNLVALIRDRVPNALSLLWEQEPVKPKKEDAWPNMITVCGACGAQIPTPGGWRYNYCPTCGRGIKWDATT